MKKNIKNLPDYEEFCEECSFYKCSKEYSGWDGPEKFFIMSDLTETEIRKRFPYMSDALSPFMLLERKLDEPFRLHNNNQSKNEHRNRHLNYAESCRDYDEYGADPENIILQREACEMALRGMSSEEMRRIIFRFCYCFAYKEIARTEKMSYQGTIKNVHKLLQAARNNLNDYDFETD